MDKLNIHTNHSLINEPTTREFAIANNSMNECIVYNQFI